MSIQLAQCRFSGLATSSAIILICQIKYTEAVLSNSTRKLLWFEMSKMLIAFKKINLLCQLLQFSAHYRSLHMHALLTHTSRECIGRSSSTTHDMFQHNTPFAVHLFPVSNGALFVRKKLEFRVRPTVGRVGRC